MKSDQFRSPKFRLNRHRMDWREKKLKQWEEQIQKTIEGNDGNVYITSPEYRIKFVNSSFQEWAGHDPVGKICYEAIYNRNTVCPWCIYDEVYRGQTVRREILCPRDNIWFCNINVPLTDPSGRKYKMSIFHDINKDKQKSEEIRQRQDQLENLVRTRTMDLEVANDRLKKEIMEREKMEAALRESQRRMADIIDFLPVATFVIDKEGRVITWNRAIEEMTGIKAEGMLGKSNYEYALPFYGIRKPILIDAALTQQQEVNPEDYYYVKFNRESIVAETERTNLQGKKANLWAKVTPLYDEAGLVAGAIESILDMTGYRQAQEKLKLSEGQLQAIIESARDGIFVKDRDFIYRQANQAMEDLIGHPLDELIGRSDDDFLDTEDAQRIRDNDQRVLAGEVVEDYPVFTQDGVNRFFHTKVFPLQNRQGKVVGICGITRDITERRRLEEEMARLDKLNVVGEMAASIAHEIRNPMTTVRGFLQLLSRRNDYLYTSEFKLMIEELDRASSILNEYLALARGQVVNAKKQSLNGIIKSLEPLILSDAMLADKHIRLELADVPNIMFDAKDIRQLILNLVRNGLEAMNQGGILTIGTYSDDDEVILAVADQGTGIPPEKWNMIGTPFFTTKEKGTGIGLAVCFSIASRHNADISFNTGPDGTTFYVRFRPTIS